MNRIRQGNGKIRICGWGYSASIKFYGQMSKAAIVVIVVIRFGLENIVAFNAEDVSMDKVNIVVPLL